jgi:hypothetical protein
MTDRCIERFVRNLEPKSTALASTTKHAAVSLLIVAALPSRGLNVSNWALADVSSIVGPNVRLWWQAVWPLLESQSGLWPQVGDSGHSADCGGERQGVVVSGRPPTGFWHGQRDRDKRSLGRPGTGSLFLSLKSIVLEQL